MPHTLSADPPPPVFTPLRNPPGKMLKGYLDDPTVPPGSLCPTFAAIAFHIDNARWDGVPFLMKAGKALDKRYAEIRVQFRHVPGNLYKRGGQLNNDLTNELVIRIQPDEAVYLKINNKVPGLGMVLDRSTLDLKYKARYEKELPDAYERLILDVIMGDKRLFIRDDELEAAWKLFTPLLQTIEKNKIAPELYPYGSRGPVGAHYLGAGVSFFGLVLASPPSSLAALLDRRCPRIECVRVADGVSPRVFCAAGAKYNVRWGDTL